MTSARDFFLGGGAVGAAMRQHGHARGGALRRRYGRAHPSATALTREQWAALELVGRRRKAWSATAMDPATLAALVERGLVERVGELPGATMYRTTDAGRAALDEGSK